MPVNEVIGALGSWYVNLDQSTPRRVLDRLGYFGHIVIHAARQTHPELIGDGLLKSARFVGVVRDKQFTGLTGSTSPNTNQLQGSGMAYWLGDEDGKGAVIEYPGAALVNASFVEGVRALLPYSGAVRAGTLHAVAGVWSGSYVYVSPRRALDDFCSYFSSPLGECEWRVNGDGTLDAGRIEDLYVTDPQAIIARKGSGQQDLKLRGVSGDAQTDTDVQDFSTRVVVLAQGTGESVATGAANINPNLNPYVDLFGNPVALTRLVSQEGTDASNAPASAVLQLNRFLRPRAALQLSSDEYDLRGAFAPGDYVWVWDPDAGLIDKSGANEVYFRGERLFPIKLRLSELTWPVTPGMGVSYRGQDGRWLDLTDYIVWEDPANVDVVVGATVRTLLGSQGEQVGGRPKGDSSIPDVIEWVTPFALSTYQSTEGITRAQVSLMWKRPNNTDATAIIDGDHYEIRWRTSAHQILPVPWGYLAQSSYQWVDLVQWDGLLPAVEGPWQYTAVGFDEQQFLIQDLTPGVPYDVQIRAVDTASPPNYGLWNTSSTFETLGDPFPPSEPAAPFVTSSPISVQVIHQLGKSSGGVFNLEADLHHLEVHAAYEPAFTPTTASLIGRMLANNGTLASQTPIVATFTLASTADVWIKVVAVDLAGNRSGPSTGVQSSAQLINDQWISNLTVSKVTAGTITSQWLVGSDIATAFTGTRAGLNAGGFYAFNNQNQQTFEVDAATGDVFMTGFVDTAKNGSRARLAPADLTHILQAPGLYLWAVGSSNPSLIFAEQEGSDTTLGPSAIAVTSSKNPADNRVGTVYVRDDAVYMGMRTYLAPDAKHPHGSYLMNGPFVTTLGNGNRAEISIVGQVNPDGHVTFNGGFLQVSSTYAYFGIETPTLPHQPRLVWDTNGYLECKGEFFTYAGNEDRIGLCVAAAALPGGSGGGLTINYGATQTHPHAPIATAGTSGFTVWAESNSTSCLVHYNVAGTFPVHFWIFGVDS